MNTESKTTETSDLREDFLAGMRYVANSVTVVTTDGKAGISGDGCDGCTDGGASAEGRA